MKLEIEITRQDYFDFNVYNFIKTRLPKTILVCVTGLIFLQFMLNKDEIGIDWMRVLISSLFYLILSFLYLYYILNKTRKVPNKNGAILGKKEYVFTDEYISYKGKDSTGQYNWSAIKTLGESKKAFYLYVDVIAAFVIPKRYFIDKAQEQEFKAYLQRHLTANLSA